MTEAQKKRYATKVLKAFLKLLPFDVDVKLSFRYDDDNHATCSAQAEYRRAKINLNLESCDTEADITEYMVHEILHIPTWPLYDVATDLAKTDFEMETVKRTNELVVTNLERMFLKLLA